MQPQPTRQRAHACLATHQYSHCLERVLRALPATVQRQSGPGLIRAIARIRAGLAAAHAPPATEPRFAAWSAACRTAALDAITTSRTALLLIRRERLGARADVSAALELLERIESGIP